MSVSDPYKVLNISPNATDEEVKAAYREMARKYHPDNYADNPLSDLAQEKMQEINEAYDAIIRMRKGGAGTGSGGYGGHTGGSRYGDIRHLISTGRIQDAEVLLDGVPTASRDAEWFFLKGSVLYRKGWLEDAYNHFSTACRHGPVQRRVSRGDESNERSETKRRVPDHRTDGRRRLYSLRCVQRPDLYRLLLRMYGRRFYQLLLTAS